MSSRASRNASNSFGGSGSLTEIKSGIMKKLVKYWKTKFGRGYYKLYVDEQGYTYESRDGGGNLGPMTEEKAIEALEILMKCERGTYYESKP